MSRSSVFANTCGSVGSGGANPLWHARHFAGFLTWSFIILSQGKDGLRRADQVRSIGEEKKPRA